MKIAVVGGGAGGMMASLIASANLNCEVLLIERNEKLGKKIYITGKGRCNITNDCDETEFLTNVVTNSKFLYSAIYAFPPAKCMSTFESLGLNIKVERGNRVFPVSDKASDVTKALAQGLHQNGVKIMLDTKIESVEYSNGSFILHTIKDIVLCDKLILACGGKSYSSTGSDGNGFALAKSLGHTVTHLYPSLVDIVIKDKLDLEGLSLKNVRLTLTDSKHKTLFSDMGEMLFTSNGVTGPLVLTCSANANKIDLAKCKLSIDLKPALIDEVLDERLIREFNAAPNKQLLNVMRSLLPERLIDAVIQRTAIPPTKPVNQITVIERRKIVETLKDFSLSPLSLGDIERAVVTSGGVNVNEINPKTMESRIVKNLYFCGEMIDVDALTGGFNLQTAFATGFVAGKSASQT